MAREERSSPPSRSTELETGEERGVREEAPGAAADGGALMAPTPGGGGRIPPPPLPRERDLSLFGMLMLTWKKCRLNLSHQKVCSAAHLDGLPLLEGQVQLWLTAHILLGRYWV